MFLTFDESKTTERGHIRTLHGTVTGHGIDVAVYHVVARHDLATDIVSVNVRYGQSNIVEGQVMPAHRLSGDIVTLCRLLATDPDGDTLAALLTAPVVEGDDEADTGHDTEDSLDAAGDEEE